MITHRTWLWIMIIIEGSDPLMVCNPKQYLQVAWLLSELLPLLLECSIISSTKQTLWLARRFTGCCQLAVLIDCSLWADGGGGEYSALSLLEMVISLLLSESELNSYSGLARFTVQDFLPEECLKIDRGTGESSDWADEEELVEEGFESFRCTNRAGFSWFKHRLLGVKLPLLEFRFTDAILLLLIGVWCEQCQKCDDEEEEDPTGLAFNDISDVDVRSGPTLIGLCFLACCWCWWW